MTKLTIPNIIKHLKLNDGWIEKGLECGFEIPKYIIYYYARNLKAIFKEIGFSSCEEAEDYFFDIIHDVEGIEYWTMFENYLSASFY